jgi:hypothetical protein
MVLPAPAATPVAVWLRVGLAQVMTPSGAQLTVGGVVLTCAEHELEAVQPFGNCVTVTVKVAPVVTVMDCVVAPLLQR